MPRKSKKPEGILTPEQREDADKFVESEDPCVIEAIQDAEVSPETAQALDEILDHRQKMHLPPHPDHDDKERVRKNIA